MTRHSSPWIVCDKLIEDQIAFPPSSLLARKASAELVSQLEQLRLTEAVHK